MARSMGQRAAVGQLLLALVASHMAWVTAGPLMAVDFGGESIRVSVVKPGRTPISVVVNEMSKRKTSAQVAFVDNERLLGEEAAALSVRYPDRVYARTRDLLGRQADDESLQEQLASWRLPYKVVPYSKERGTAAIQSHTGEIYSAEELVASIIHYARSITEAATEGAVVLDCVITVPAFWGPTQRQALVDAAKVSGVNVLALVNTHAAAALQYGIERDFANKTELVVFYDMGATSTECALVEFSSFRLKEGGSMKTYGQFEVKDVAWDATLGSEALDLLLLDHFADEFKAAHPGLDPRDSPKAVAKLRRQVKRTKEVLSANTFAPISVEELQEGHDFRSRIDRDQFEALAGDFLQRSAKPLAELLERNKVAVADLRGVELLGGGSRVPAVKAALSAALGGRQLDTHMDADEAVVLGAGLFAANLSTTFRLRKFGMNDGITYPITFLLEQPENVVGDATEGLFKPKALLPRMKRLPARRMVPLPNITSVDSLRATLSFNTSDDSVGLPPGARSEHLATFEISGMKEILAKHKELGKLSLHFRADESGILSLDGGEAVIETTEEYTVKVPVEQPLANDTDSQDNSTGANAADEAATLDEGLDANETETNATAAEQPPPLVFKDVVKTRKKTVRAPLTIGGPGLAQPGLSPEALKASKKVLEKLAQAEAARKEASRQKNELEAYIISFRGRLDSDDNILAVTTEQQRSSFWEQLDAAEEWLYSEGEHEPAAVFMGKLRELKKTGDAFELRAKELKALPKATKNAQDFVKVARQAVGGWTTTKPWLNATEVESLKQEVEDFESWLKTESQQQQDLKPHEEPSLLSAIVDARLELLRKPFNRLKAKKKPKPPPAPKAPANETADAKAEAAAEQQAAAEDTEPQHHEDDWQGEPQDADTGRDEL